VLSLLLLVPFLGAALVTLLSFGAGNAVRCQRLATAFGWMHLALLIGWIGSSMDWSKGSLQLREEIAWPLMPGISLTLGIDGLSWLLMVVGTLVFLNFAHRRSNPETADRSEWAGPLIGLGCLTVALACTDLYVLLASWQLLLLIGYLQMRSVNNAHGGVSAPNPHAHRFLVLTQSAMLGLTLAAATYFQASSAAGIEPSANLFDLQSQSGTWKFVEQGDSTFAFPIWTLSLQLVCFAVLLGLLPFSWRRPRKDGASDDCNDAATSRIANGNHAFLAQQMTMILVVYGMLRVVLPLAPEQVSMAALWVVVWGLVAGGRALLGSKRSDAIPAFLFALIGAAAWHADSAIGGVWLDLALLLLIFAVTVIGPQSDAAGTKGANRTFLRGLAVAPLAAFVVLYFSTPGIEATLKIVRRTMIGEDLG